MDTLCFGGRAYSVLVAEVAAMPSCTLLPYQNAPFLIALSISRCLKAHFFRPLCFAKCLVLPHTLIYRRNREGALLATHSQTNPLKTQANATLSDQGDIVKERHFVACLLGNALIGYLAVPGLQEIAWFECYLSHPVFLLLGA